MTKPLSAEEKQRRAVERNEARERQAIKDGAKTGKTASQAMEDLRKTRVQEAKPEIEAASKAKEDFYAKEDEERRKFVELENAKRAERERLQVELQRQRAEETSHPDNQGEEKVTLVTAKQAPFPSKAAKKGLTRCEGSGADATKLELVGGRPLTDKEGPWDWKGRRVQCPECHNRIGISPYGSRKTQLPVGWKVDTHYRKVSG